MRHLIAVSILAALASVSRAATLSQVCGRFMDGNQIIACQQAAHGRDVDSKALDICDRFMDGDQIIACVGAAAGREYTSDETTQCNRFMDGNQILSCLRASGRTTERGDRRDGRDGRDGECEEQSLRSIVRGCTERFGDAQSQLSCIEAAAGM
ncbi:MAG: hypothetical protein KGL53_07275 [Elusimicrobia bacterium]|nr:hypothetical protein [Elusimicrobiota bacterium]